MNKPLFISMYKRIAEFFIPLKIKINISFNYIWGIEYTKFYMFRDFELLSLSLSPYLSLYLSFSLSLSLYIYIYKERKVLN